MFRYKGTAGAIRIGARTLTGGEEVELSESEIRRLSRLFRHFERIEKQDAPAPKPKRRRRRQPKG